MSYWFKHYTEKLQRSIQIRMLSLNATQAILIALLFSVVMTSWIQSIFATSQTINDLSNTESSSFTLTQNPDNQFNKTQQMVSDWLARRYRVSSDATQTLVLAAYSTAREVRLDPLLILSVIAVESSFNPLAESSAGAQGLMQVMAKIHQEKFDDLGGIHTALNPVANIKVGSAILKDYITRGGSVEAGLKMYVGAGALDNDEGYGVKVLTEYHRLKAVAQGKEVPILAKADIPPVKPVSIKHSKPKTTFGTGSMPIHVESQDALSVDQIAAL